MKIGVQLPEVEREVRWRELADIARAVEESGLDSAWLGDHLLYRDPERGPWEAWTSLAGIAAITSRIELGPLVACLGFHNPAMLAKQAATVDEISGGRLIFGLGAGWNRTEFDAFGFPYDHRVDRFAEAFTIVRRLFTDDIVSFDGTYHSVAECSLLPAPARVPPMMIGSLGERMLAIALPHVELHHAWYAWFGNSADGYSAIRAQVDAACAAAGRDPSSVARSAALYVQLEGGGGRIAGHRQTRETPPLALAGLRRELDAIERLGVSHVQLVLDPITRGSIEHVAETLARR